MGKTINQLSTASSLSSGDQIVVYSSANGDARKSSLNSILSLFQSLFTNPEFEAQIFTPTSGQTIALTASSSNIWAVLNPTTALASLTVVFPAVSGVADGQEIIVSCSEQIDSLTLSGNGADIVGTVSGVPTGGFGGRWRYNEQLGSWYIVSLGTNGNINVGGGDLEINAGDIAILSQSGFELATTTGTALIETRNTASTVALRVGVGAAQLQIYNALIESDVAFKVLPVNVASLPAAATAGNGARHFVSDANATTFASVVAGGGANRVPVYSDGTNWRIG